MDDVDAERAQHSPSDPSSTYNVLGTHIGTLPGSRGTNVGGLVSVRNLHYLHLSLYRSQTAWHRIELHDVPKKLKFRSVFALPNFLRRCREASRSRSSLAP